MVQPVPSTNHAGPYSPLTTEAEPSARERRNPEWRALHRLGLTECMECGDAFVTRRAQRVCTCDWTAWLDGLERLA